MREYISTKGIRVFRQLITLHNALYERYKGYDWKGSSIYPDFKNYLWTVEIITSEEGTLSVLPS